MKSSLKSRSHVYECAISSESTVGYFGSDISYCYSLRNEDHQAIFVLEIICKGMTNEFMNLRIELIKRIFNFK